MAWLLACAVWVQIVYITVYFGNFTVTAQTDGIALPDVTANPITRFLKLALIAIGIAVALSKMREAKLLLRQVNIFFLILMGLAIASVAWSADPGATIGRFVGLCASVFTAFAFCLAGWHRRRFQDVLRPLLTLLLIGSLIFGITSPRLAIDADAQAGWHGLANQKNPFGELAAFGAILWMHGWIAREIPWWKAILGAGIAGACLVLSKSSTSMLATIMAVTFTVLLLRMPASVRRYSRYIVAVFAVVILAYALAVLKIVPGLDTLLLGPITALTGKDMTFSNRSVIWELVKEHAQYHPLLGTGFGAYWTSPTPDSQSYVFVLRMYFWPSESHNGYLEIVNDLGAVGLVCLLGYLGFYVRQSLKVFRFDRVQGALFLALFFQQAMTNLSESCWFSANGILPVTIMNLATFAMARAVLDQKRAGSTTAVEPPKRFYTLHDARLASRY